MSLKNFNRVILCLVLLICVSAKKECYIDNCAECFPDGDCKRCEFFYDRKKTNYHWH